MIYELVVGWTGPIDIQLLTRGATPSGNMSGITVALVLKDRNGTAIDTTGDLAVYSSTAWVVRFTPDPADLTPGIYMGRIKLTDSGGLVSYFPSGEPDTWIVRTET